MRRWEWSGIVMARSGRKTNDCRYQGVAGTGPTRLPGSPDIEPRSPGHTCLVVTHQPMPHLSRAPGRPGQRIHPPPSAEEVAGHWQDPGVVRKTGYLL